ncbi:MAG: hypothetical protein QW791_00430 [Candidatus Bathyarchaeia archaeon]
MGSDVTEASLVCPFCGALYRETIPAGTVQVKCRYCGATILVPPSLGGVVRRCPNHPETLAVGICNDCGQSFCTRCLYVLDIKSGRLYVCAECYRNRTAKSKIAVVLSLGPCAHISCIHPISYGFSDGIVNIDDVSRILFLAIFLLAVSTVTLFEKQKSPPSLYDMVSKGTHLRTPKSFVKRCVKCGREIPITSGECPYCQARQPEYKA